MIGMRVGSLVVFTGLPWHDLAPGAQGKVLDLDYQNASCHVLWSTGAREHQVDALYVEDLAVLGHQQGTTPDGGYDGLQDSLDYDSVTATAARSSYDGGGARQVVAAMAEQGHLQPIADYLQSAIDTVAALVRQDPTFLTAVAGLSDDETEEVFRVATASVLADVLGAGEDEQQ